MSKAERWVAVQGRGENEALSRRMLVDAGAWRVFWPYYVTVVRGSVQGADGKRERPRLHSLRSWLPGRWMFIPEDQLPNVYRLRGEMSVVFVPLSGGRPIEIPSEDVLWMRSFAEPDGLIPRIKSPPPKMVEIKGENLRAVIKELSLGVRAAVLAKGIMGSIDA
jgi:hypothetical protein